MGCGEGREYWQPFVGGFGLGSLQAAPSGFDRLGQCDRLGEVAVGPGVVGVNKELAGGRDSRT